MKGQITNPTGKGGFKERRHQINRDGRPKNGGELGALFRRIGNEIATTKDGKPVLGPDGKPMTVVEAIARQKAQDKKYQEEFLNRAYGKVPDKHQFENEDGSAFVLRVEYVNKRTDNNPTDAA